ncbi:MAG: carboxymethylenebutenolidase [Bacteroidetes bacterium]|nr:carboxymethylenebutenolidase [Bacteroidota bacterium]
MKKYDLLDVFNKHVEAELNRDLETTLSTMALDPHINNIPTLIGGEGLEKVRLFYKGLIPEGKFFPPDTEMYHISRTMDEKQLVDEMIFKFTHSTEIGWMLPKIPPTGKKVEVPLIVIVGFSEGKVSHEHIYWDQASVLVQIGLLNAGQLPVSGIESALKMRSLKQRREV